MKEVRGEWGSLAGTFRVVLTISVSAVFTEGGDEHLLKDRAVLPFLSGIGAFTACAPFSWSPPSVEKKQ